MKIAYANPAPDEDMYPGEAVHWKARGKRYFSYKDLWFQQLDRSHVVEAILHPLDQSLEHEASFQIARLIGAGGDPPRLGNVGLVCTDTALARQMLDRNIDFVFDFETELFFFDSFGKHERLMGELLHLYTGAHTWSPDRDAEAYLSQGRGMFRSSQSGAVHVGANTNIPAWMKIAQLPIRRMEAP